MSTVQPNHTTTPPHHTNRLDKNPARGPGMQCIMGMPAATYLHSYTIGALSPARRRPSFASAIDSCTCSINCFSQSSRPRRPGSRACRRRSRPEQSASALSAQQQPSWTRPQRITQSEGMLASEAEWTRRASGAGLVRAPFGVCSPVSVGLQIHRHKPYHIPA